MPGLRTSPYASRVTPGFEITFGMTIAPGQILILEIRTKEPQVREQQAEWVRALSRLERLEVRDTTKAISNGNQCHSLH